MASMWLTLGKALLTECGYPHKPWRLLTAALSPGITSSAKDCPISRTQRTVLVPTTAFLGFEFPEDTPPTTIPLLDRTPQPVLPLLAPSGAVGTGGRLKQSLGLAEWSKSEHPLCWDSAAIKLQREAETK
ncbi:Hypothetical predicted protein [Pelobates cultripes]|uniref:Uncharacterized protein n=1 Tax=Pelobates cultripes TaxID=61616 RepID=A0AAD1VM91_PELCU|nr:Hypothetical predicted protein [Pelobates cultripes]